MRKIAILLVVLGLFLMPKNIFAKQVKKAYTDYGISLDEAVEIQLNEAAKPITDLYRDAPAYVNKKAVEFVGPNRIKVFIANIRTAPSLDAKIAFQFPYTIPVEIIDIVTGDAYQESELWFKIAYQTHIYYIHSSLVKADTVRATADAKVYEGAGKNHHTFGKLEKGETVQVVEHDPEWLQVHYRAWRIPKREDVKEILDPNDTDNMYQHIRLDESIGVSADELNVVLEGKGILEGLGQAFIDGGKKHGINEAYLIAHAFLETAQGTSELATGVEVGVNEKKQPVIVTDDNRDDLKKIKTTYNMFGIGAADSCPLECGAKTAYEEKWFDPETAIREGAAWIGKDYIYNEFEQNTLYKMKWNPKMGEGFHWKQYATDIEWAEKQTKKMKEIYKQLRDPIYSYDIPTYEE